MARLITDYLERTAERIPAKIAAVDKRRSISYGELREEAHRVAQGMMERGFFGRYIGVFMDKCVEFMAAFDGIAYAGNAFVPLDIKMPLKRLQRIMGDISLAAVITDEEHLPLLRKLTGCGEMILYSDLQRIRPDEMALAARNAQIIDTDPLQVMFTSGSTGRPKGVVFSHRTELVNAGWLGKQFRFGEDTVFGNQPPFFFTLSYPELYASLRGGCTEYLLDHEMFVFPAQLMEFLREHSINTILWVPSVYQYIASVGLLEELGEAGKLPRIELGLFAGSVMPNRCLNRWRRNFPAARFVNIYGMTETGGFATFYEADRDFSDDDPLPMGRPMSNRSVLVLGDGKQVLPEERGKTGELYVRGSGLALGYVGEGGEAESAFCRNPLRTEYHEKILRTGDIVRYNEYGELVYAARTDAQIKHQGRRIELGEIEVAMAAVPGVVAGCCLYDEVKSEIVYFYEGDAVPGALRQEAKETLPHYMEPARFEQGELPMTPNGKIDRVALRQRLESHG